MKRSAVFSLITVLAAWPSVLLFPQPITSHDPLFMPFQSQPLQGGTVTDPVFGTSVTRLTDSVNSGNLGIVPQYSKRQAWNANDSLIMLLNGDDGYFSLYDGTTGAFLRPLDDPAIGGEDVFWHPLQKNIIIYAADSILCSYDLATSEVTELHVFEGYTWINTRGEGNLSNDGHYYAFVGQDYNYATGEVIFQDIIVYDLFQDQVVSTMPVSQEPGSGAIDWMSVSSLGNYVVVDYSDSETGRYHGVEVYDRNMGFLWQAPLGAGHSDTGMDEDGGEVLVKDVYDDETNVIHIRKFRLSDGEMTNLLDLSPLFDLHISLRNVNRPGWCFVSTFDYVGRLTDDSLSWLPFEDEVFALRTDGNGDVERIAHHHSRRFSPITPDPDNSVYWAEPHATVNKAGTKVLWGSNWRINMDQVSSVDTYLCDFTSWLGIVGPSSQSGTTILIYPNPVSDFAVISWRYVPKNEAELGSAVGSELIMRMFDFMGREVGNLDREHMQTGNQQTEFDASGMPAGIYFLRLQSGGSAFTIPFLVAR
jgi:hypothetical protein